jgi:hypothetical protein
VGADLVLLSFWTAFVELDDLSCGPQHFHPTISFKQDLSGRFVGSLHVNHEFAGQAAAHSFSKIFLDLLGSARVGSCAFFI